MSTSWRQKATVTALVLTLAAPAACGRGSGEAKKTATSQSTGSATPDKAAFCRLWAQFQTGTSYHPGMAAYRQFWGTNDRVAKQLVGVAPSPVRDDVTALAKGVASINAAAGRATSPQTWSPAETKLYLKQVRLPEIHVSNYADTECPSMS